MANVQVKFHNIMTIVIIIHVVIHVFYKYLPNVYTIQKNFMYASFTLVPSTLIHLPVPCLSLSFWSPLESDWTLRLFQHGIAGYEPNCSQRWWQMSSCFCYNSQEWKISVKHLSQTLKVKIKGVFLLVYTCILYVWL